MIAMRRSPARLVAAMVLFVAIGTAQGQAEPPPPPAPVYANTEEVYFAREAGRLAAPLLMLRLEETGRAIIDAFGAPVAEAPAIEIVSRSADRLVARVEGHETVMRRARPVTCWAAVRKDSPAPDGSPGWLFERGLALHDQGGRARLGGESTGAPEATLRMRQVTWPGGSANRPSLVLYVHTADDPQKAASYAWADSEASRVGINLRWMQASCTVGQIGAP